MSIKLQTSDNEIVQIDKKLADKSETISNSAKTSSNTPDSAIPVDMTAATLRMVIQWLKYHQKDPVPKEGEEVHLETVPEWDQEFLSGEMDTTLELLIAADHLKIRGLVAVCAKTVADNMKGKSPEQIRTLFNIPNDLEKGQPKGDQNSASKPKASKSASTNSVTPTATSTGNSVASSPDVSASTANVSQTSKEGKKINK